MNKEKAVKSDRRSKKNAEDQGKDNRMTQEVKNVKDFPEGEHVRNQITPVGNRRKTDIETLAKSARQIATMQEPRRLGPKYCDEHKIIYPEMPNRDIANNFREIRTKMLSLAGGNNFIAMVTSVGSKGGASFVALNLASAFSFEESKTAILIDCNLRHPKLHDLVELEQKKGLTDYLEDTNINIEEIIYSSGIPRMRMIPVGEKRESVVEYFTSVRMKGFLDAVHSRYMDRFIFLDAPPIGESVDARILAELCDFVVLVVEYGKVTQGKLKAAVEGIGKEKLAGIVFNREPEMFMM